MLPNDTKPGSYSDGEYGSVIISETIQRIIKTVELI